VTQKKFNFVIILFFILVVGSAIWNISKNWKDWTTPTCQPLPADFIETPRPAVADTDDLVFLTSDDKQKLYDVIDSATTPEDFENKFFMALTDTFDSYNAKNQGHKNDLYAPEILTANTNKIEITSGGCKTNLLEGLDLTPIRKDDMPTLKSFAKIFIDEIFKYPLPWLKQAIPPFIVFVKSAKVNGEIVGGLEHGAVIYNITSVEDVSFSRKLIHHELMHWLELASRTRTDTSWPELPDNYINKYNLSSDYNYLEHPADGFVTGYAKTNIAEDKAEIYSYLFSPNRILKLKRWTEADPVLNKKVEYIKGFIKARAPKMDVTFFDKYIR
jgi:hypothetical protein